MNKTISFDFNYKTKNGCVKPLRVKVESDAQTFAFRSCVINALAIEKAYNDGKMLNYIILSVATFEEKYLENISFNNAVLRAVSFNDCYLDSGAFVDCNMNNVTFRNCDLTECDFRLSQMKCVMFEDCKLKKCDFRYKINTKGVTFKNCQMEDMLIDIWPEIGTVIDEKVSCQILELTKREKKWIDKYGVENDKWHGAYRGVKKAS